MKKKREKRVGERERGIIEWSVGSLLERTYTDGTDVVIGSLGMSRRT